MEYNKMVLFKSKKLTKLFLSIINGSINDVKEIVDTVTFKKHFINKRGNEGATPLVIAIREGKKDIVEYLIEMGADIERTSIRGNTPLSAAILFKRDEILYNLIYKYKANWFRNISIKKQKYSLLEIAIMAKNYYAVNLLVENKYIIEDKHLIFAIEFGDEDIIFLEKLIVDYNLDINYYDENAMTPLTTAIAYDNIDTMKFLLDIGADPNFCKKDQKKGLYSVYPLGVAIQYDNFDAFKMLIDAGAYVIDEVIMLLLINCEVNMLKYLYNRGHNIKVDYEKMKQKYPYYFSDYNNILEYIYYRKDKNKYEIADIYIYELKHAMRSV